MIVDEVAGWDAGQALGSSVRRRCSPAGAGPPVLEPRARRGVQPSTAKAVREQDLLSASASNQTVIGDPDQMRLTKREGIRGGRRRSRAFWSKTIHMMKG